MSAVSLTAALAKSKQITLCCPDPACPTYRDILEFFWLWGLSAVPKREKSRCFLELVIRKHRDWAEDMIDSLQDASRLRLSKSHFIEPTHPVWTTGGWKRFLSSRDDVRNVIRYVENNPVKIGLSTQHWDFVRVYDGWPKSLR